MVGSEARACGNKTSRLNGIFKSRSPITILKDPSLDVLFLGFLICKDSFLRMQRFVWTEAFGLTEQLS